MAQLLKKPFPLTQPNYEAGNYEENKVAFQKQDTEFQRLFKMSEQAEKLGMRIGRLFGHPVGDGSAWYLVVKLKPFTLQWIPYMDAWQAPAYVLRGLRPEDL